MMMKNNLILLITILILSNVAAYSQSLRSGIKDDEILEVTCLGKYTGAVHSFIYFAKNETSTDYYVIRTAWLVS